MQAIFILCILFQKVLTCLFLMLIQSKIQGKQMNVRLFVYKIRQQPETSEKVM